jgi:hypothetical protein
MKVSFVARCWIPTYPWYSERGATKNGYVRLVSLLVNGSSAREAALMATSNGIYIGWRPFSKRENVGMTLRALYFSPGLFFSDPSTHNRELGPLSDFHFPACTWTFVHNCTIWCWLLFLDLECERLLDLINLYHGK